MNRIKQKAHDIAMAVIDWQIGRDIRRLMRMKEEAVFDHEHIAALELEDQLEQRLFRLQTLAIKHKNHMRIAMSAV